MDRAGAIEIVSIISAAYPNYRPQYDKGQMKKAVDLWAVMFNDTPLPVVAEAVKRYIGSDNEFAPSIGNIRRIINDMSGNHELPEAEAWSMVVRALRNGTYGAEKEFARLPKDVQKAIGSPAYLQSLATSEDVNMSVESSNFYRSYRSVVERRKNEENIPENIMGLIDRIGEEKPLRLEDKQTSSIEEERVDYADALRMAKERYMAETEGRKNNTPKLIPLQKMFDSHTEEAEPESGIQGMFA